MKEFFLLFTFILITTINSSIILAMPKTQENLYSTVKNPIDIEIKRLEKTEEKNPHYKTELLSLYENRIKKSKDAAKLKRRKDQEEQKDKILKLIDTTIDTNKIPHHGRFLFIINNIGKLYFTEAYTDGMHDASTEDKHTRLSDYEELKAAGEIIIQNGKLLVTNYSSQYNCPCDYNFKSLAFNSFKDKGIVINDIVSYEHDRVWKYYKPFFDKSKLLKELKTTLDLKNG